MSNLQSEKLLTDKILKWHTNVVSTFASFQRCSCSGTEVQLFQSSISYWIYFGIYVLDAVLRETK